MIGSSRMILAIVVSLSYSAIFAEIDYSNDETPWEEKQQKVALSFAKEIGLAQDALPDLIEAIKRVGKNSYPLWQNYYGEKHYGDTRPITLKNLDKIYKEFTQQGTKLDQIFDSPINQLLVTVSIASDILRLAFKQKLNDSKKSIAIDLNAIAESLHNGTIRYSEDLEPFPLFKIQKKNCDYDAILITPREIGQKKDKKLLDEYIKGVYADKEMFIGNVFFPEIIKSEWWDAIPYLKQQNALPGKIVYEKLGIFIPAYLYVLLDKNNPKIAYELASQFPDYVITSYKTMYQENAKGELIGMPMVDYLVQLAKDQTIDIKNKYVVQLLNYLINKAKMPVNKENHDFLEQYGIKVQNNEMEI